MVDSGAGARGRRLPLGSFEESAAVAPGADADEGEVAPCGIGAHGQEPRLIHGMPVPGPGDHRLLRVTGEQIAPPLPVSVPELDPQCYPSEGAPDDLPHHGTPGQV